MNRRIGLLLIMIVITAMVFFNGNRKQVNAQNFSDRSGIPARLAADYIHSVIEADRTIYSKMIVERLGEVASLKATENWLEVNTLPLPAQFLLLASENVTSQELGMYYRLMSLWPINPLNGPNDVFEKKGLEEVIKNMLMVKSPNTPKSNSNANGPL